MMRVLFAAGHDSIGLITADHLADGQAWADRLRGSTGARGEREWTGDVVQRLAAALNATGLVEASFTDAIWHDDVYSGQHYALVVYCHFHRDADPERAMFAAPDMALVPDVITAAARAQAQRFVDRLVGGYERATGIPVTEPLITLNMTQLYSYDYPEADCPMICAEFGNANLDNGVLYTETGLAKVVRFMRDCVLEHLNLTAPVQPIVPVPAPAQPAPAASAVLLANPMDVLHEWALLYAEEAPQAGIRSEIALAQALHETGHFTFPGRAQASWNNPCGLGVGASSGAIDCHFPTKRDGVRAHLAHLLRYFSPTHTAYCVVGTAVDPRHGPHLGYADDVHALDGHWAVPGVGYGDKILALVPRAKELLGQA